MSDGLEEQSSTSELSDGLKEQSSTSDFGKEAISMSVPRATKGKEAIDADGFLAVGRELDSFLAVEIRKREGLRE